MSNAPRYRLVGYDIGTAPDENGGWVHWTDHEAEIARLTAERDSATRAKDCFQRMTRAHWEALCAMRNSINEYIPMPNTDSGPLFSPEDGPIYADIAERVIADLAESRAYALALEQELRDRAEKAEADRDAARKTLERANKDYRDLRNSLGGKLSAALKESSAQAAEIARLTAERDAEIARLTAERRMIISHATMGGTDGDGLSVNAVSVQITALRNELYQDGKSRAEKAEAERDAAMAGAVKVKPLVWVDFHDRGAKAHAWNEANYMIQKWSDGRWEISASYPGYSTSIYGTDRFYPTIEAAKAAAQADYDARILAAIQPDPDARQAALAAAWTLGRDMSADWHGEREQDELAVSTKYRGGSNPWFAHCQRAKDHRDAAAAILALLPPADLAAKIGGE